ncbi:hypothetical protein NKR23_g3847 [Pleurostoma richardsiae]|uniref:Uncharacterized protein n=1 Tax=Pleurostoma richardsiae TaxID=41990 RepID=A0AA38VLK7_9PEZI|nr:hypothetical protein NKR23_g3847 [Pleurostoma richardsiae]
MNPTTVAGYVDALISDFDSGLLSYARWKKRKESENHYCKQSASPGQAGVTYCALSTSLRVSGPKIQETYELGSAILGPNFSTGDALCLGLLSSQLLLIRSRTDADTPALPDPEYFDGGDTAVWPTQSPMPQFLSEPPSPPLTPQLMNNGIESAYPAPYSKVGAVTCGDRPINGVFSVFCPEALALQVDIKRQVPARRKCQCGYLWGAPELSGGMDSLLLKDGFRMTRRFLAKSHCEPRGQRPYGMRYGCVLCTSTGWTETHETAEHLRVHINASHIKWQMLHDRDLTALQPIAA